MFQVKKDKLEKTCGVFGNHCCRCHRLLLAHCIKKRPSNRKCGEAIAWWDRSQNVQEVHEGSVHNYLPHKYPIVARVHLNPYIRPYLTRNRNFGNQVEIWCSNFWELVDKLKSAGLKKHRHLDVVAKVALYRTKLRQDISIFMVLMIPWERWV